MNKKAHGSVALVVKNLNQLIRAFSLRIAQVKMDFIAFAKCAAIRKNKDKNNYIYTLNFINQ